jgi:hypothetical protein
MSRKIYNFTLGSKEVFNQNKTYETNFINKKKKTH